MIEIANVDKNRRMFGPPPVRVALEWPRGGNVRPHEGRRFDGLFAVSGKGGREGKVGWIAGTDGG